MKGAKKMFFKKKKKPLKLGTLTIHDEVFANYLMQEDLSVLYEKRNKSGGKLREHYDEKIRIAKEARDKFFERNGYRS